MRGVVSNSVFQAWRDLFPPQQQFPAPAPRSHHTAGFARSSLIKVLRLSLGAPWEGSSLPCTSSWWGTSQQQFWRVYLRMGYPKPTCVIKNHRVLAQSQRWWLSSEAEGLLVMLRRGAGFAHWSIPSCRLKHCSRMFTYIYIFFKEKGKKNQETNQNNAKGKHQQENSMFFVMLFLRGHLLLAIRLNH